MIWPPDYSAEFARRANRIVQMRANPVLVQGAHEFYKRPENAVAWIEHWGVTYDPRVAGTGRPAKMPFLLFDRQRDLVQFLIELLQAQQGGLIEKARDMGATWLCASFSVYLWRYWDGAAIGWGSRKEQLVDKLGDPDSIFEKMRMVIRMLPPDIFWPKGFRGEDDMPFMRIINPETGATITGEAGDNIGRGGRKLAMPHDTPVLTPKGWALLGSIQVGDFVIGSSGVPVRVRAVFEHGRKPVSRVSFSDGTSARCSGDHLWTVTTHAMRKSLGRAKTWGSRGPASKTISADDIALSLDMRRGDGQTARQYQIPIVKPIKFLRREDLPLDPYVVGVFLGDGSVGQLETSSPTIAVGDRDCEWMSAELGRTLPDFARLQHDGHASFRVLDTAGRGGAGVRSRVKEAIRASGIFGMKCADKFVPDAYKFASPEQRLATLQGLLDTDGWCSTRRGSSVGKIGFASISERLAQDVVFLVQSLGGTANYARKKTQGRDAFEAILSLPNGVVPFRMPRKAERVGSREKYAPRRSIVSVEPDGEADVRCISVDAEDGLFLVNDCIITHNCYFKDESAHYERPEKIEAALGDNTNVQVDISSVNGVGNVFYRRRKAGVEWEPGTPISRGRTNVFVMDWRDHPGKTPEWYKERKQKFEDDGLSHIFAQEVDRNYSASVEGVIIQSEWVNAAIDAHTKLGFSDDGAWLAAMDVADEGLDKNALAGRKGVVLRRVVDWGSRDPGEAARQAVGMCEGLGPTELHYDCIGVGAGVKAEANRLKADKLWPKAIKLVPWNAAASPLNPLGRVLEGDDQSPKNEDYYANLKAQGWWELRMRLWRTFRAVTAGIKYPPEQLISISSEIGARTLRKLEEELCQPVMTKNTKMKLVVDKKPDGTASPNIADCVMMAYWPARSATGFLDALEAETQAMDTAAKRRLAEIEEREKRLGAAQQPAPSNADAWLPGR